MDKPWNQDTIGWQRAWSSKSSTSAKHQQHSRKAGDADPKCTLFLTSIVEATAWSCSCRMVGGCHGGISFPPLIFSSFPFFLYSLKVYIGLHFLFFSLFSSCPFLPFLLSSLSFFSTCPTFRLHAFLLVSSFSSPFLHLYLPILFFPSYPFLFIHPLFTLKWENICM